MGFTSRQLLLLLFFYTSRLFAADPIPILHLGIDEGLSNNSVRAIYKDHNGFMWFGTYDGLNRYDGYEFKIFRNKLKDTTSLPHNYIYAITEDHQNNLWVGTGQGIGIYNNLTSKFLPAYYISFDKKRKEKLTANVNALKTDSKGNVFIGTNGWGLLVQYQGSNVSIQVGVKKNTVQTSAYEVRSIAIDNRGGVWLFIQDVGLCFYDYAKKEIRPLNTSIKGVNCMEADGHGNLWIGTSNGLYKYSIASGAFLQSFYEGTGKLTSNNIASLAVDRDELWIGTEGGGITILHTQKETFQYLLPGESNTTLSSESVFAIYVDGELRKWMGTLKGGVNIMDPQKGRFRTVTHDPLNRYSLINNFVSCFFEDEKRNLWIGTDGGGISVWNRKANSFTNFKHENNDATSLSNNLVNSIKGDHQNNIWLATFGGGINRFNSTKKTFDHYKCINPISGEENKNVWLLLQDRENNIWATTFANGKLYKYNQEANRFDMFDKRLIDLISITEDKSGTLWAGDSHQLIKIDKQGKRLVFFEIGKPVRAIYEDKVGNFWLGTEGGGLILFNRKESKLVNRFSDAEGLCNNAVLNILEDSKGNLWLSTFNGLSRFTMKDRTFKNFYQSDGLQSNQFLYNSAIKLQSGELVFGGVKGFTIFHPDSLQFTNHASSIIITSFLINNKPAAEVSEYIIKREGDKMEALKIPYNEATLSFDFVALEYSAPDKILYAYYLEGWDKSWNYAGNIRKANYTHLQEGTYHLHIKATNAEGIWNGRETTITITVLPPWYRTWWAYFMYGALVVGLILLYVHYKTQQTKLAYKVKLAGIETEKEKELAQKKLSFFTDISHEFRTPLTLIINPLKDFLQGHGRKDEAKDLHIVYRNARRLLSLVDQLLLFQKAGTEEDRLKISKLNFYDLCKEVYFSFSNGAKAKKLRYEFVCENEALEVYADKEKLEIILFNLLSNALKFTPAGGRILFEVTETNTKIAVAISDTGPGILPDLQNKLFQKFYQVPHAQSPSKPGFGIGLYLVKHFIEKHNGEIYFESKIGSGTTFTATLKKGKAHFAGETIVESSTEKSALLNELAEEETPEITRLDLEELITGQPSLLVVEDNKEIREYVISIFKESFSIYEAASGEDGFALAEKYLPDMVISDVMMENGSGIEMCHRIKHTASLSHIPVILLTGIYSDEIKLKGIECGADDYITKPFEKDMLIAKVTSILKNRTALQNYFFHEITLKKHDLKISSEYKEFLERCIAIVENHLEDDDFNIKKLAQEVGMSHSNLYRKVKSISGQSIAGFIRFIRLRKAAELLIQTDSNINEVSFQVGISDTKYFRKQFNALFGMNPSEYIKKYRSSFNRDFILHQKITKAEK